MEPTLTNPGNLSATALKHLGDWIEERLLLIVRALDNTDTWFVRYGKRTLAEIAEVEAVAADVASISMRSGPTTIRPDGHVSSTMMIWMKTVSPPTLTLRSPLPALFTGSS